MGAKNQIKRNDCRRRNIIDKKIKKENSSITISEITLANNETKDIIKKPLENWGILSKWTTKKILVKKEDFSIFWSH